MYLLFRDGTKVYGNTATEILEQISGGWNPRDLFKLRRALLHRSGVYGGITDVHELRLLELDWDCLSDDEYLTKLDAGGFIVLKRTDDTRQAQRRKRRI
jgi:hypothetical protein